MGFGGHEDTAFDAVILTYAHVDHAAYIHYLRPDIPIYCTEATKLILQCLQDTSPNADEYITFKETYHVHKNEKTGQLVKTRGDEHHYQRHMVVFEPTKRFAIDSIEVEPIPVDHSVPGVSGFILYTSKGSVAYTADIRFHGRRKPDSENFVQKRANSDIDLILCEGTRVHEPFSKTEFEVENDVKSVVGKTDHLVVYSHPTRDLDRLLSFYNAARESGRDLVIDLNQVYLLDLFQTSEHWKGVFPKSNGKNIRVYVPRKNWGLLGKDTSFWTEKLLLEDYKEWEKLFLDYNNRVDYQYVSGHRKELIFYCSDFQLKELIDVRPEPGSQYIRSTTEPFDDEMELSEGRVLNWLVHFGLITKKGQLTRSHISGHGDGNQIEHLIEGSESKMLIPIHTTKEKYHQKWHSNVKREDLFPRLHLARHLLQNKLIYQTSIVRLLSRSVVAVALAVLLFSQLASLGLDQATAIGEGNVKVTVSHMDGTLAYPGDFQAGGQYGWVQIKEDSSGTIWYTHSCNYNPDSCSFLLPSGEYTVTAWYTNTGTGVPQTFTITDEATTDVQIELDYGFVKTTVTHMDGTLAYPGDFQAGGQYGWVQIKEDSSGTIWYTHSCNYNPDSCSFLLPSGEYTVTAWYGPGILTETIAITDKATIDLRIGTGGVDFKSVTVNRNPVQTTTNGFRISAQGSQAVAPYAPVGLKIASLGVWAKVEIENTSPIEFNGGLRQYHIKDGTEVGGLFGPKIVKITIPPKSTITQFIPISGANTEDTNLLVRLQLGTGNTFTWNPLSTYQFPLKISKTAFSGPKHIGNVVYLKELEKASPNPTDAEIIRTIGELAIKLFLASRGIDPGNVDDIMPKNPADNVPMLSTLLYKATYARLDSTSLGSNAFSLRTTATTWQIHHQVGETDYVFSTNFDRVRTIVKLPPGVTITEISGHDRIVKLTNGTSFVYWTDNYVDKKFGPTATTTHTFKLKLATKGKEYSIRSYSYFEVGPYSERPTTDGFPIIDHNKWKNRPGSVYWVLMTTDSATMKVKY
jgi:ribonuclease J